MISSSFQIVKLLEPSRWRGCSRKYTFGKEIIDQENTLTDRFRCHNGSLSPSPPKVCLQTLVYVAPNFSNNGVFLFSFFFFDTWHYSKLFSFLVSQIVI